MSEEPPLRNTKLEETPTYYQKNKYNINSNPHIITNAKKVASDLIVAVTSKPFKTEYEHEYGGGRLSTDPRVDPKRASDSRWYVPDMRSVADGKICKSIMFKRANNKISGSYAPGYDMYSSQACMNKDGTRDNYQDSRMDIGGSDIVTYPKKFDDNKGSVTLIPYGHNWTGQRTQHGQLGCANSDDLKRQNEIGATGGGEKRIRIINGPTAVHFNNTGGITAGMKYTNQTQSARTCRVYDTKPLHATKDHYDDPRSYAGKCSPLWDYTKMAGKGQSEKLKSKTVVDQNNGEMNTYSGSEKQERLGVVDSNQNWERLKTQDSYVNISRIPRVQNPFRINRPTSVQQKKSFGSARIKNKINFDSKWNEFCRGKLSNNASLCCQNCGYVLCKQLDIIPHALLWMTGNNRDIQTGFGEDDCDGGLKGTFSRLYILIILHCTK